MYYNQVLPQAPFSHPNTPISSHFPHIIEVTGEGTVSAAPDQAIIELGTVTENPSLTVAQKENAAAVSNIINSLLQLNIPREHIQTINYRIDIEYNFEDGKQIFRGYKVTHLLQITTDKVDQTGVIVDTAVNHGANTVSSVQFALRHPEMFYSRALTIAVTHSLGKANSIAHTLGASLNKFPIKVEELSRLQEPVPYQTQLYAKSSSTTPIQPGELKISAAVKAVFSFY